MAIDVAWANRRLAKSCLTDTNGVRFHGEERWHVLRRRLAALLYAPTLADLENSPGRCHALTADRAGQFAMNLDGPQRLVFEPSPPTPRLPDGGIDRHAVVSVIVIEIANYHDE